MTEPTLAAFSVPAWREAIRTARIAPLTKLLCFTVADYLHHATGLCRPSLGRLAEDTGLSRRTVKAHVRRGAAAGLLEISDWRPPGTVTLAACIPGVWPAPPPALIVLAPGDPRWAAWIAYHRQQPGTSGGAQRAARNRTTWTVDADWPPPSTEVDDGGGLGLVAIPWGTPEHAAWLAHWRRTGRTVQAQAADLSKRQLLERGRWPLLPAPSVAQQGQPARGAGTGSLTSPPDTAPQAQPPAPLRRAGPLPLNEGTP